MNMKATKRNIFTVCLSLIIAFGVGALMFTQTGGASDSIDENNIELVVEKKDFDTLKISLSNVTDVINAIQFKIKIEGDVEFNQNSLEWLVQSSTNDAIKKAIKVDEKNKEMEFVIVSTNPLQKIDAGMIEIAEIDINPLVDKAIKYTITTSTNKEGTGYKYVVNATNKQVTGSAFNLINDGILTYNTPPQLHLIKSPQVMDGKIYLTQGDEFTQEQQKAFVIATDAEDGDITNVSVTGTVDTAIVGSYLLTYSAIDSVGDETTLEVPVIVENVVDATIENPVITGVKTEVELKIGDSFDPLAGVEALDYLGRNLEIELSGDYEETLVDGIVTEEGIFTIYYNAQDRYGNVAAEQQTTLIVEGEEEHDHGDEIPVITGVKSEVKLTVGDAFDPLAGVQALDYLDNELDIQLSGDFEETLVDGIVTTAGNFTIYYNAQDERGHVADEQQTTLIVEADQGNGGGGSTTPDEDQNEGGGSTTPDENQNEGGGSTTPDENQNEGEGSTTPDEDQNQGGGSTTPDEDQNEGG
ncbi:MAG TPA: hypothetical protein DCY20_10755, partial [Firmicutes bacterium]|nr:hypothetical protein [Bacillota bacterium]